MMQFQSNSCPNFQIEDSGTPIICCNLPLEESEIHPLGTKKEPLHEANIHNPA